MSNRSDETKRNEERKDREEKERKMEREKKKLAINCGAFICLYHGTKTKRNFPERTRLYLVWTFGRIVCDPRPFYAVKISASYSTMIDEQQIRDVNRTTMVRLRRCRAIIRRSIERQSNCLFEYAHAITLGSLSKIVKWKRLEHRSLCRDNRFASIRFVLHS